jgi:hypothetical protein
VAEEATEAEEESDTVGPAEGEESDDGNTRALEASQRAM